MNSYEDSLWMEKFHVSRNTFMYILNTFGSQLARKDTLMRESVPVEKRVAVGLFRLATGSPYNKTGEQFGIGRRTSLYIKDEFCEVLVKNAKYFIKFPTTEEDTRAAIDGFEGKCQIPQLAGAIKAVRFKIKAPSLVTHKMKYYNDNLKCHSMILQAVTDSSGKFLDVSTGYPGGITNTEALAISDIYKNVKQGVILNSPSATVEGLQVKPIIATDASYKLRKWCICPYPDNNTLSPSQERFNSELGSAVHIAEDALARLRGRWNTLARSCLDENVEKIPETVLICCVLHNICVEQEDPTVIIPHPAKYESTPYVGKEDSEDDTAEAVSILTSLDKSTGEDVREALRAHVEHISSNVVHKYLTDHSNT
ncbi:protein ANTAGONIST OF LIKE HETEROCHROMATIN PROTEIN 1 [Nematostella vectensis]|nr:protein ANTAGONIST OF LIKE HETEROCHROMATIN PROTEIN 1 [Nematostella vectensis]